MIHWSNYFQYSWRQFSPFYNVNSINNHSSKKNKNTNTNKNNQNENENENENKSIAQKFYEH